MKKTLTCVLFFFLVSVIKCGFAQVTTTTLQGNIVNENLSAAEAVTVVLLLQRDSSFYKSVNSGKNGFFKFINIKPQSYIIMVSKVGYKTYYTAPYRVSVNQTTTSDTIKLLPSPIRLSEVIVTDKRKYIDIRPDKTVLNVDRNILANGVSVFNLLNNAPGVKINPTGGISLRGGQQASIAVNGKLLRLNENDLANYLQNLQSADVEQIDLIQNPSVKDDAIGNGGLINIILKKGKNIGFNGSASVTAGTGRYDQENAAFTANYRSKRFNVFGNAGFNYRNTDHKINTLRNVNYNNNVTTLDTRYYNTQRTPAVSYGIGTDFFIDSAHTIGFLVKGSTEASRFDKQTKTAMLLNQVADSTFTTLSNLKRNITNVNYNINYAGTIGHTKQTLSADADLQIYNRRNNEVLFTKAIATPQVVIIKKYPALDGNDSLRNTAPTRYVNKTLKVDYVNPISMSATLEAGIKGAYIKNTNSQAFDMLTGTGYEAVPNLTSIFNYTEKTGTAYVNFIRLGKVFNYRAGLRVQHTLSDANTLTTGDEVHRSYMQYFPMLQLNYQPGTSSLFTFDYNRTAELPAMESLNPIIAYQDNYNYTQGNAYLKPAYSNRLQLAYTLNSKYYFAAFFQTVSNFWHFSYFNQNDATKVLVTTKRNIDRENYYGVLFNAPFEITRWWNADLNSEFSHYKFRDSKNGLDKGGKDIILNLNQDFTFSKNWAATVYANYESPTYFGLYSTRQVYYLNAGISRQLLNRTATISLTAEDIFNTRRDSYLAIYSNLDISGYDKVATQIVRLTFTYRFGKKTVKAARRHVAGNDDEQKRMGRN